MIPPRYASYAGRQGTRYWRARRLVLAASDVCHICQHGGARTIDHFPHSVAECRAKGWIHLLDDPANMKPAHGTRNECPTCGRSCNQDRANGVTTPQAIPRSREW